MKMLCYFFLATEKKKHKSQIDWMNNIWTFTGAKKTHKNQKKSGKKSVYFFSDSREKKTKHFGIWLIDWPTNFFGKKKYDTFARAEANLGVLACKISVLRKKKLVIICATRAEAILGVLACKISVLLQKLVIICATRAGAILVILAFKISVLRQKWVVICNTRTVALLSVLAY